MIGYHEMRKLSPEKARELVRIVFEKNNQNISKTAKILGISRKTVRRAINGPLSDISRKPKSSPNKTPPSFEELIIKEAKRTGFRYRRLKSFFERKYSLSFSENTIKAILKRNGISKEKKKRFLLYCFVILWLRVYNVIGIVENSHRQDDEYFLGVHAERCKNKEEFLRKAERWQDTWNFFRPSFVIGMNGKTPVILLKDLLKAVGLFTKMLSYFLITQYIVVI